MLELTVYLGQVTFTPLFISNTRQVWQKFCSKSPLEDLKREYIVEIETEWGKITVGISYLETEIKGLGKAGLGNRECLKVLNDTKLVLNEH